MEPPAKIKETTKPVEAKTANRRKLLQVQYEEEYLQALISTKEK
jgi:hypothetical protein